MTARKKTVRHPGPIIATKQYPHGTNACYSLNFCHCDQCKAAHREYENGRKLYLGAFPRVPPPLVDAAPVRRHVKRLMAKGMSPKRIAGIAGVPASAVGALIYGRYDRAAKRVRRQTAEKLLAVQFQALGNMKVPNGEALALIDELVARGWSKAEIGKRVHGPKAASLQVAKSPTGMVEASTILKLRPLLDEEVPKRQHPRGHFYLPKGRPPRPVPRTTPGLSTDNDRVQNELVGRGHLRCDNCSRPLAFHIVGQRCA